MSERRPVVIVLPRRRPVHEILFLLLSLFYGTAFTFADSPPSSIVATMGHGLVLVWAVGFLVSGALGLFAMAAPVRKRIPAAWLEAAAMLIGAGALVIAGTAILIVVGWQRGLFGWAFCAAWAIANLARVVQIYGDMTRLRSESP